MCISFDLVYYFSKHLNIEIVILNMMLSVKLALETMQFGSEFLKSGRIKVVLCDVILERSSLHSVISSNFEAKFDSEIEGKEQS